MPTLARRITRNEFSESQKEGLYRAIYERRDIRKEFLPRAISKEVILKLLNAAHHAGSVGFMQPWNFIVINDLAVKQNIKRIFEEENIKASSNYEGDRKEKYLSMKLEGILESPVNVCVTCDPSRNGPHVLGRNTIFETDLFSTCCAIQNLWLAARAEGIGMGWVSILDLAKVSEALHIPAAVRIVAYLCLGYIDRFPEIPMLEEEGWQSRLPLETLVSWNRWQD